VALSPPARGAARICTADDVAAILEIVNDAAQAYRGVIPPDCWHDPYMSLDELRLEIGAGVQFHGWHDAGPLLGVIGLQDVQDVCLIRHAYVRTHERGRGIGTRLLQHLLTLTQRPVLVGTWAAAVWAIRFYEKHGFELVRLPEKERLLRRYWTISPRQIETSVVLVDARYRAPS
jgi:GNAT superfamily N-acetyltransferase